MATPSSPLRVTFNLSQEEMKLARRLAKRENRDGARTVNLWAKEVLRQYIHEYKVMPGAWGK